MDITDYSLEKLLNLNCLDKIDSYFEEYTDLWIIIFQQSIINAEELEEQMMFISMKSSNTYEYLSKLKFTEFMKINKRFIKIMELENNNQNGGAESQNDNVSSMMNQSKSMMNSMKSNMKFK